MAWDVWVDPHVPCFQVFVYAFGAAFTSEPRVLDASEWCGRIGDNALVDSNHAKMQCLADFDGAFHARSERVCRAPVLGVIGPFDRFTIVAEGDDGSDGSEDLFT